MADAEQKIGIVVTAKDEATPELKKTQKTLQDFSETAFKAAEQLSNTFGKKNIDQAQKMANVLRSFNQNNKIDTKGGLDSLLNAKEIKDVGSALAQLTSTQASSIMGMIDEPTAELEDLSDTALLAATHLSAVFSKDQINKAKELARAIRSFNQGLEQNTKKGLGETMNAQTVEELGQAFANLSSTETSALSGLYEEPQKKLSLLEQTFNRFSKRSEKSLHSLKRFLDRISNIIVYRLIRQGLSLMVSQVQEGTKAVYMWSRAFNEIDENRIAQNLDMIATKLDNIRGNLGAAWGTILANFSGAIEGALNKISDGIEKVTAFASALNGSATYARVAETNVKRYYEAVTNGLQGITVIGRVTQMEDAPIPDDIKGMADTVRGNLEGIGNVSGALSVGVGLTLLATGHVVAALGLLGVGLKLASTDHDIEGLTKNTETSVLSTISKIQSYVGAAELAIGTVLLLNGKVGSGAYLIERGIGNSLSGASGQVDPTGKVGQALSRIKQIIEDFELPVGLLLACLGNPYGYAMLAGLVVDKATYTITHWEEIKTALSELGDVFSEWWDNTFIKGIVDSWNEFWSDPFKAVREDFRKPITYNEDRKAVENGTATSEQLFRYSDRFKKTLELGDLISAFTEGGLLEGLKHLFSTQFPTFFADGGFPSAGSLFIAGEVPGQTELLGTINGRTGVAGGAEITGIREAIYEVGAEIIASMRSNNVNVTLEGDADGIFNIVRQKASDYTRATGNLAF